MRLTSEQQEELKNILNIKSVEKIIINAQFCLLLQETNVFTVSRKITRLIKKKIHEEDIFNESCSL